MTGDDLKKLIEDAERNAKDVQPSFVKSDMVLTGDIDLAAYDRIRTQLPTEARMRLAADYELYREVSGTLAQIRTIATAYIPDDEKLGPLVTRLLKRFCTPPTEWAVCSYCRGTGENAQVAKCVECKGAGYVI